MRGERYDIFISHTSEEDGAAVRIAEKLREAGFQPWIDNWNCAGGGRFQREIDEGIEGSGAFAVLIGPSGISNWVAEEIEIARSLAVKNPSFRLFVVMLPGYPDSFDRQTIPATLRNRGAESDPGRVAAILRGYPVSPHVRAVSLGLGIASDPSRRCRFLELTRPQLAIDGAGRQLLFTPSYVRRPPVPAPSARPPCRTMQSSADRPMPG